MKVSTIQPIQTSTAIALLIAGNGMAMVSDVFIKWQAGNMPLFQFIVVRALITLLILLPFWRTFDRTPLFAGFRIHLLRSHIALGCIAATVYALAHLPLATANAIFYSAPVLVMGLSVLFVRERLNALTLITVISGFIGVVVILRPVGFGWAALAAFGVAVGLALSVLLVPKLPAGQGRIHSIFINTLLMLPAATALAVLEGGAFSTEMLLAALGSAVFILGYNVTVLMAYSHACASQVTSAEYTGILWAVALGWLMFQEQPDVWFVAGALLICLPLLASGLKALPGRRPFRPQESAA